LICSLAAAQLTSIAHTPRKFRTALLQTQKRGGQSRRTLLIERAGERLSFTSVLDNAETQQQIAQPEKQRFLHLLFCRLRTSYS
jgi:hypothetical protein